MHAEFDLKIARFDVNTAATGVVTIGTRNSAYDHCYGYLQIETAGNPAGYLSLQSTCGPSGTYSHADLALLPLDWVHITLDIDVVMGIASMNVGSQSIQTQIGLSGLAAGTPALVAGIQHVNGLGPKIALDDLVVTLTP
jgi:hypothetical protein